jgi:hypothetical protein
MGRLSQCWATKAAQIFQRVLRGHDVEKRSERRFKDNRVAIFGGRHAQGHRCAKTFPIKHQRTRGFEDCFGDRVFSEGQFFGRRLNRWTLGSRLRRRSSLWSIGAEKRGL